MNDIAYLISNTPVGFFAFIFFIVIPLIRILKNFSITSRTLSNGGLSVEGLYVPSLEFYKTLRNRINVRGVDGIELSLPDLPESSPYGDTRKYMRIRKSGVIFYVCAFRLGSSQVFTYWEIAPLNIIGRMIAGIPFLGSLLKSIFFPDTLYKRDVASAIKGMIMDDFRKIVNEQGENKGVRELAESNLAHLKTIL